MVEASERSVSFGAWADEYERHRTRYPAALVDDVLRPVVTELAAPVVDIGAGTGILTRTIRDLGFEVIAVEPDDRMRAVARARFGEASVRAGSAEAIPLPDASAAAVVGGQMWHWVDPSRAVPEIARVLLPRGSMTIFWILRDDWVPWVAEVAAAVGLPDHLSSWDDAAVPQLGPPFGPFEVRQTAFSQRIGIADVPGHLRTYSSVALADDADERLAAARVVLERHRDVVGPDEVDIPFVCKAFTATRAES